MSKRLNIKELIPESYEMIMQMSRITADSEIDVEHQELIKIRASQINGCAFCMNIHSAEAVKLGIDPKRLFVLSAWREAKNWFSQEDQTVLKLTEEVTLISDQGLTDQTYNEAVGFFGEILTAKMIMAIININAFNRIAVSTNMHPL